MRAAWLVVAGACATPTPAPPSSRTSPPARGAAADVLPAGTYWYGYSPCHDCDPPTAATVLRFATAAEAAPVVHVLEGALPLGYPLVVDRDELTIGPGPELVVVLGLHRDAAVAHRYLAGLGETAHGASVIAIDPGTRAADTGGDLERAGPHFVSRIDRGGGVVAAYPATAVELGEAAPAGAKLCDVMPGDFFVVRYEDLLWYSWAPVRCGNQLAYIPWRRSLLGNATVLPDGPQLRQVTAASCDMPAFTSWSYSAAGRGPILEDGAASCGHGRS